ncbi:MAG: hypothetical protein MUO27_00460, partial [Sedimentisphaerales bacterium]|nr:hypothetical protein [Sedimentisphaerales bacterium]
MLAVEKHETTVQIIVRLFVMLAIGGLVALMTHLIHFNYQQILASAIFITIIAATLLFWQFRLAIAFIGISVLIATNTLDLPTFIQRCQLDVIVFLIGMMVIVGVLKDLGLFTWIIQGIIRTPRMSGLTFVVIIAFLSALMSCIVDEVTSIVFIATLIFQVCDAV